MKGEARKQGEEATAVATSAAPRVRTRSDVVRSSMNTYLEDSDPYSTMLRLSDDCRKDFCQHSESIR